MKFKFCTRIRLNVTKHDVTFATKQKRVLTPIPPPRDYATANSCKKVKMVIILHKSQTFMLEKIFEADEQNTAIVSKNAAQFVEKFTWFNELKKTIYDVIN